MGNTPIRIPLIQIWAGDLNLSMKFDFFAIKVGLGISQTNVVSQWNPVYSTLNRIFCVKTKRFVGSSVNVISTRQTCSQR